MYFLYIDFRVKLIKQKKSLRQITLIYGLIAQMVRAHA